jgi:hypothetical protein
MTGIRIEDGTSRDSGAELHPGTAGCLSFDLIDILRALGERAQHSVWRAEQVDCFGEAYREVMALVESGDPIPGERLSILAERLTQVIDGTFIGTDADSGEPWVVVHAIDSTFWEVWTDDPQARAGLAKQFRAITPIITSAA